MSSSKNLKIPLQDILSATNKYAESNVIAKGGFGNVYRGQSKQHANLAIKQLDRLRGQGDRQYGVEVQLLSKYKHENLVTLVGFCEHGHEKILVYKFEANGSLDKFLPKKDLTWMLCLQICLDAAHGLRYLHDGIGDENPCGTPGYVDPVYYRGELTQKSDVYSFGVVLFEVLFGKVVSIQKNVSKHNSFAEMAQNHYERNTLDDLIHPDLRNQMNPDSLIKYSSIAYECLKIDRQV